MFFKFVVVLAATTWLSCPPLTNEGTMLISKMADKLQLEIYRGLQFDQNLIITTYFNRKYRLAVKYIYKPLLALLMKFDLLQMPPCLFVIEWLRILMWRGPWEWGPTNYGIKHTSYKAHQSRPFTGQMGLIGFGLELILFHRASPRNSLQPNVTKLLFTGTNCRVSEGQTRRQVKTCGRQTCHPEARIRTWKTKAENNHALSRRCENFE